MVWYWVPPFLVPVAMSAVLVPLMYVSVTTHQVKSVQSTLSHLITTSVQRAMFAHLPVRDELFQYYLY